MKTEEDIYADQQITLREAIANVVGKITAGIPITDAREILAEAYIFDWVEKFGEDAV